MIATDPHALDGRSFGPFGTAGNITTRAAIAVDPNDPHAAVVADIELAPCNAKGLIEAAAEIVVLRPIGCGNGTLLLELPNCGRKLWPMLFDDALEALAQRLEVRPAALAGCFAPNDVVQPMVCHAQKPPFVQ